MKNEQSGYQLVCVSPRWVKCFTIDRSKTLYNSLTFTTYFAWPGEVEVFSSCENLWLPASCTSSLPHSLTQHITWAVFGFCWLTEQMQPLRNVNGFYFFVLICSNVQPELELNIAPLPTNPVNGLGPETHLGCFYTHGKPEVTKSWKL